MHNKEERNFKRYESQSECEVTYTETYKGRIVDYSDGIGAILKNAPQLIAGTHVNIMIFDPEMELKGEVVWTKKLGDDLRVGFRRVDNLKGPLKDFKLADILIGLQRSTRTGILKIESGLIVKKIFIKNGDVIFAVSNNEDDRLGELLLKEGKITLEEYNQSINLFKKTGEKLGRIFVKLGCLTPKEVFLAVRHQIEEIILSIFTIEEGRFEFQEGHLPTEELITLRMSAANLIYRGIKRVNNFLYIKQVCPPRDAVLNLSSNPLNIYQDLTLENPDKKILSYVNGMYSIKTILSLSPSKDFETLKTICAFLSIGLIKVKREDEAPVELPIKGVPSESDEEKTTGFVEKIEDMFNRCETLGYYEVLGIEKEASIEEIKKAYYGVSKQFHPDRHFALPSHDIKGKLIKILFYITRAYKTLSDPEKRKEYDRTLSLKATRLEREVIDEPSAPEKEVILETIKKDDKDEESQLEIARTAHDDALIPEGEDVYKQEEHDVDISEVEEDVIKAQKEFEDTQLEEEIQQTSELTSSISAVTGYEPGDTGDKLIDEGEIEERDEAAEVVSEQPSDMTVEEFRDKEEEAQLDTVKATYGGTVATEKDRIKIIPVVMVVAVILVVILSVMYENFNKGSQRSMPAVTKAEEKQRLPLPPFRDELFEKLFSEAPEPR